MEEKISKIIKIFDKLSKADISPTSNYSMFEYWMHFAIKGDEMSKDTLFNTLSLYLGVDKETLNAVFDKMFGNNVKENKRYKNESKNMNKKVIRLTESDLHRIVKESVKRVLKEGFTKPFKGTHEDEGFPYMIVTYNGEEEVNREHVTLPRPGLHAYDDEVPFSLGSNQALIELD